MIKYVLTSVILGIFVLSWEKESVQKVNDLEGSWNWLYSCGGFAGCVNADKDNKREMIISEEKILFVDKDNRSELKFQVKDEYESEGFKVYELELHNGVEWTVKIKEPELIITNDLGSSGYKRM